MQFTHIIMVLLVSMVAALPAALPHAGTDSNILTARFLLTVDS
jgi:hypothetical protein